MPGSAEQHSNDLTRRQLMGWLAATGAAAAAPPLLSANPAWAAGTVNVWLPLPTDKVRRDRGLPANRPPQIALQAARNEYESGQLIVRTAAGTTQVGLSASALTGAGGATIPSANIALYRQHYVNVPRSEDNPKYGVGWYPDALVPLAPGATIAATATQNAGFWFTVRIPQGQTAGAYTGTLTVTGGDARVVVQLTLDVWNFVVPDASSFDTACTIWYPQVGAAHNLTWGTPAYDQMMRKYWDFQTAFRLNTNDIPIRGNPGPASGGFIPGPGPDPEPDIYLAQLDQYLADPRVRKTRFPLYASGNIDAGFEVDDDKLRYLVGKLREKGVTSRGYFYFADEPLNPTHYNNVRTLFERVDSIAPDVKHLLTLTDPPSQDLIDFVRAWAFVITAPKPELPGLVQTLKARGDWIWWYTAWGHNYPQPSVFIHDSLVGNRLLPWIQHFLGVEGYLFWSTSVFGNWDGNRYRSTNNWQDRWTNPNPLHDFSGDGFFLYPGTQVGIDGPVGSIRLHGLREGFEDAEYLTLYERRTTQQAATWGVAFDSKTALLSYHQLLHDTFEEYADDPAWFHKIRAQVGAEVAQLHGALPALVHVGRRSAHGVMTTVHVPKGAALTVNGIARTPTGGTSSADTFEFAIDLAPGDRDVPFAVSRDGTTHSFTRTLRVGPAATPHEIIVNSFELDDDVTRVRSTNATVTRSNLHAVTGKSSAKMVFAANVDSAGAFFYTGFPDHPPESSIGRNDWSTFDAIAMDIYNDSPDVIVLTGIIYNTETHDGGNWFYLAPGANKVRMPFTRLATNLTTITSLELRAPNRSQALTLYVDNVRFERAKTGLASPGTWLRQDAGRRPTLHVVKTDGAIAMARQTGADPAGWAFTNASDDGLRGPVAGAAASAIDAAARLNLVARSGSTLQWSRESGPGGTWQRATLSIQPDNGPTPTLVGVPAAGLDVNGKLTFFSRTSDGFLAFGRQVVPGSSTWQTTYLSVGGTRIQVTGDPATIQDPSGKLTFFAQTTGGQVLHGWEQAAGGAAWSSGILQHNGTGAAAIIAGRPAVTQSISGRLMFHARDASGRMVHGWQSTPGNGPWLWEFLPLTTTTDDGGNHVTVTIAGDPTSGLDAGGRPVYFARTAAGTIYHSWHRYPDKGPWLSTVLRSGGSPVTVAGDGANVQDSTGRLHFFARAAAGTLRHLWQDAPGIGPWLSADLGSGIA